MQEHSQVVVAYDFSHSAHAALTRALELAERAPWHVLHIVAVIDPRSAFPELPTKRIDVSYADLVRETIFEQVRAELRHSEVDANIHVFAHARIAKKAADEILQVAFEVGADLIIIGSKGVTGVERALLGSTSERVVREAGCTVEVARPKTYEYVALTAITEHEKPAHYAAPHRYSYEETRVLRRPKDWPLY